jgi:cellulose synthase/poly-beta-1,6-N-acetylglucosamine synthase-like glycosyltransferase
LGNYSSSSMTGNHLNNIAVGAFWIGVIWFGYTYAGYPFLLWVMGIFRRVSVASRDDFRPTVSVLIAAHNEAQDIGWKIAETLAWDYPSESLDVWVASDASDDDTEEIVRGIRDPRVKLVKMPKRGGKARALNRLAQLAKGQIILFTDANAHIGPHCLARMVRHFADPRVGCVTGATKPPTEDQRAIGGGTSAFQSFESVIFTLESRLGSVLVCDGAIFSTRCDLFSPLSPDLANDLELPIRIAHSGYWTLYEPEAEVRELDTCSTREEWSRRRRICAQGILGMWNLRRAMLYQRGWQFFSHKVLRYLTLVPLVLVLWSSIMMRRNSFFGVVVALEAIFYGLATFGYISALLQWKTPRLAAVPFYIVFGSLGALVGILDTCRGRRFDVWEAAALSRGPQGTS